MMTSVAQIMPMLSHSHTNTPAKTTVPTLSSRMVRIGKRSSTVDASFDTVVRREEVGVRASRAEPLSGADLQPSVRGFGNGEAIEVALAGGIEP
jgi:hypothetical protein